MDGGAHHRTSPAHRHPWHKPTGDPVGSPEGRSSSRVLGAPRKGGGRWVGVQGLPRTPLSADPSPKPGSDPAPQEGLVMPNGLCHQPTRFQLSSFGCPGPPSPRPRGLLGGPVMPGTGRGDGRWTRGSYAAPHAPIRMATGPRRPPEGGWGPCEWGRVFCPRESLAGWGRKQGVFGRAGEWDLRSNKVTGSEHLLRHP